MLNDYSFRALGVVLVPILLALGSCNAEDPATPACVEGQKQECSPLYDPTFDEIFARTLQKTCADGGSSCHGSAGRAGGLVFEEADQSYALLLGEMDGLARVNPGDAGCSLVVERLESQDAAFQMPPGAPLSVAERCAIETWIREGARR